MLSVLHQACADLPRFPAHWRLSINAAPQQILDAALVPQLLAVLREHGVAPARLDVELTETALAQGYLFGRPVPAGQVVVAAEFAPACGFERPHGAWAPPECPAATSHTLVVPFSPGGIVAEQAVVDRAWQDARGRWARPPGRPVHG